VCKPAAPELLILSAFAFGAAACPQYTCQVLVLLGARWAVYRAKRWHYYLLDFCYFANLLLLVHLWAAPHSALLSKVRRN
jgi:hypothetical protein